MKKIILSIFVFCIIFSMPFLHIIGEKDYWYWNSGDVENKEEIISNTYEFMQFNEELEYYDDDVKNHFNDVRTLYWQTLIIITSTILLSLVLSFFMKKKEMITAVKNSCKGIIASWIILGAWTIISFNSFFSFFHKIFFSGNYSFSYDNLVIRLFPQILFENFGIIIGFSEIIFAIIIIYLIKD